MSNPATHGTDPSRDLDRDYPGAHATQPREIPRGGWVQVVKRAWAESKTDQVPLLAAGVAFFSFLSLFPAMIAAVMVYGLVADPQTVAAQVRGARQGPARRRRLADHPADGGDHLHPPAVPRARA